MYRVKECRHALAAFNGGTIVRKRGRCIRRGANLLLVDFRQLPGECRFEAVFTTGSNHTRSRDSLTWKSSPRRKWRAEFGRDDIPRYGSADKRSLIFTRKGRTVFTIFMPGSYAETDP